MDAFLLVYGGLFLTLIGFAIGAWIEARRAERDAAKRAAADLPPEKPATRLVEVFVAEANVPDLVSVTTLGRDAMTEAVKLAVSKRIGLGEFPKSGRYIFFARVGRASSCGDGTYAEVKQGETENHPIDRGEAR